MSSEQSHDTNKKLEWYCPYFSHSMIHFTVPQDDISKDPDCLYQELEGVSFLLVHWELNVHGISQGLHQEFWMSLLSRMAMERYFLAFCIGNGPKHMKTWSDHTTVISFCIPAIQQWMDVFAQQKLDPLKWYHLRIGLPGCAIHGPDGKALQTQYKDASNSVLTYAGISDKHRYEHEIQSVGCNLTCASKHAFSVIKNYPAGKGMEAVFDMTVETGEIATAVVVPSISTTDYSL